MRATRTGLLLFLAALASAQQATVPNSSESSIAEPQLPVIDYKACPGEGRVVPNWKIHRNTRVFSSWGNKRVIVDTLKAGEKVTILAGLNVVREPGQGLIKREEFLEGKGLTLKPGDVVFLYGFHADGDYDLWAKGVWFTESHETIAGKGDVCGFSEKSMCTTVVVKDGWTEWWVQVKTASDRTGWVLATKFAGGKFWDSGNFDELCTD